MRFGSLRNLLGCAALVLALVSIAGAAPKEESVSLTAKDGWPLAAVYLPAKKEATVVLLHDLGKNKEQFSSFKKALANAGFGYVALDLRGHGQSTSKGDYKTFAKEGADNPFNAMMQDAVAAVAFLKTKNIPEEQIFLLGTGLGANVAAKTAGALPNVRGIALISPSANLRDVLPVPALRAYKGAVLLAASGAERKGFLEASILRNVAFLTTGEGKVTFLTAYELASHELLDKYLTPSVLQWISTPEKPQVLPDAKASAVSAYLQPSGTAILPSNTEQALMPSVLVE